MNSTLAYRTSTRIASTASAAAFGSPAADIDDTTSIPR